MNRPDLEGPELKSALELVASMGQACALYDASGMLIAASSAAKRLEAETGVRIGTLQELTATAVFTADVVTVFEGAATFASGIGAPGARAVELDSISRFLRSVPVACILMDRQGTVQSMNPAAERLFGFSEEEFKGRRLPLVKEPDLPLFRRLLGQVLDGQTVENVELRRMRKDGVSVDIQLTAAPLLDAQGGVEAVIATYRDITELRGNVDQLRRSQSHLAHAQQLATIGTWELDFVTNELSWSPEVHRIHGTTPATFKPTRAAFREMVFPADLPRLSEAVATAQATGQTYETEYRIRLGANDVRHLRVSGEPMRDSSGQVVKLFGIVQDVTTFHRLQQQLLQSQKLETVGRLAGGVAHDFNNLLTIINGHAELLLLRASDPLLADSLRAILDAGQRASALTSRLLTFGRRHQQELRRVDLNVLATEASRLLRRILGEGVEIQAKTAEIPLPVKADVNQLHQALLNLALNAKEAMPKGGTVVIQTSLSETAPAAVSSGHPATSKWAEVSVSDTGTGMDEQTRARLFEPFFSTKDTGLHSGLGLSTVHGIVSQHCGAITVESAPGEGATFHLFFPIDMRTDQDAAPEPRAEDKLSGRAFIVEDQPAVRAVICAMIDGLGLEYSEFASPDAALQAIERDPDSLDVLVSDLVMPGMNGGELARRARQFRPSLPILLMSGYSDSASEATGAAPNTEFLSKPFTPQSLAARLRILLRERPRSAV